MSIHEHTIAVVTIGGVEWQVDWPTDPRDEDRRDTDCGAIFDTAGRELEVIEPTTHDLRVEAAFTTAAQVLGAAVEWLNDHRNPEGLAVAWRWVNGVTAVSGLDSVPQEARP
ncbi:MAG: hypothetical protein Q4D96_14035 [Propionibacteriaceae bacterium]|nr:hypothetical protein [Propionibacteriaceae bacterium]